MSSERRPIQNLRRLRLVFPNAIDRASATGAHGDSRGELVHADSVAWAYTVRTMEQGNPVPPATSQTIPAIISPEFLQTLRDHGVVKAELFGSFADGTAGPDSDIDLLVAFGRPVTLFQKLDVADELSRLCGRQVDMMTDIDPAFW